MNVSKVLVSAVPTWRDEDLEFIQRIRMEFDPRGYEFIEPHFTLFSSTQITTNELSRKVKQKLVNTKKIKICLNRICMIPPSDNHIFWYLFLLPAQGYENIASIHNQIKSELQLDNYPVFIPHVSVGRLANKITCQDAANNLINKKIRLNGTIEKIKFLEIINERLFVLDELQLE